MAEVRVTKAGLEGDRQRNFRHHGGPDRALCLYATERIAALQGEGHPIVPGAVGENVTVEGLHWPSIVPGVRLRLGEVEVEVTSFTTPCRTIRHAFSDGRSTRIAEDAFPGWSRVYARVLTEGLLRVGDPVHVAGRSVR